MTSRDAAFRSDEEHKEHLRTVLQILREKKLYAKLKKCDFRLCEFTFLGHVVFEGGVSVNPRKVEAIKDWPRPTTIAEIRNFLGLAVIIGGRAVELLEALEAMAKDNQHIVRRAMMLSRKYRTLVSSWIEPLQEEADVGFEIDYVARTSGNGNSPSESWLIDSAASNHMTSLVNLLNNVRLYHGSEHIHVANGNTIPITAVGDITPTFNNVFDKVLGTVIAKGPKDLIALAGLQDSSSVDTPLEVNVKYHTAEGEILPDLLLYRQLVDEELDELIFRIKLRRWEHGVWKSRFMGETLNIQDKTIDAGDPDTPNMLDDDVVEDVAKEAEENEADEEEEVVEQTESQVEVGDISKDKEVERAKPLQMIAIQLLKDSEETNTTKKSQRAARASVEVYDY
uniref:Retrovirus-related Pol polyprotein from transposon TNT 1-94-like beta-barrel domain-containing protein n=1 Tax=Ananas comosus var. bracteatus TaxID=296719 RepID=A0A6V7PIA6_ANACO|nr:unnamed protein product [Ananas comosus var. bracteatus]